MRCPNCQTINPANAKFCMECGNRLLVCSNCGTINLPNAKFCIECGTSLQKQGEPTTPLPTVQPAAQSEASRAVPGTSSTRNVIPMTPTSLLPPEERRVVTIMFADIIDSTPIADHTDPEDMRAMLTGYFNLMAEQIRKHGGTVEKYIGDAVMSVFGSPLAHEDDPDRAIRAALDMQTALNTFNEQRLAQDLAAPRLQMRIGINTGEVATPNNAQHQRRDFLITGDAVNVAARLQQVAAPDTILVGERTYLATRDVFDFRPVAPLRLKGKPEPVISYVVLGLHQRTSIITQHPRGIGGRQAPLIGRQLELTLMHTSYARVQAERHPHLITLLGAPGIGKSRLVRDFIAREQEASKSASAVGNTTPPLVLKGRCPPYGEGITYWPLIEILRSLLHVQDDERIEELQKRFVAFVGELLNNSQSSIESTDEIANTILRSIGSGLSGTVNSQEEQAHRDRREHRDRHKRDMQRTTYTSTKQSGTQMALLRAWRILLEALAQRHPLIVVVDDLQWADEALLDLLEYLTDRITNVPILFLCPARPDFFDRRRDWGGGRRNFTTIELEALSREESSELIDALLNSDDLPEVLRHTILTRSEGNPFFVEEIVRMFIDQGILVCEEDHAHDIECWRIGPQTHMVLSELTAPTDHPDNTLLNMHYILPLPRVPDTVQGVLAARVDLLSPAEKLVLQHAAIIGRTFWLSALFELASELDRTIVEDALISLTRRDFIVEVEKQIRSPIEHDRIFIFKHVLIRDVVYSNIPRMRRSQEHACFALWLEDKIFKQRKPFLASSSGTLHSDDLADTHAMATPEATQSIAGTSSNSQGNSVNDLSNKQFIELLAYHYQQALISWSAGLSVTAIETRKSNDPEAPIIRLTRQELRHRAITYLVMAGDEALHSYYTIRALQAYNDAIELLSGNEIEPLKQVEMHEKLGDAHSQRGTLDEAWQEYRKALRIATESTPPVASHILIGLYERLAELPTRWLGDFNNPVDMQEVRGYIDAGLRLVGEQDNDLECVAFLTYQAFWYVRQLETATYQQKAALAEQALNSGHEALRLAEELNDASMLSLALDVMGVIYREYHKYTEAYNLQHRRLKLEQRLTDREELYDLYLSMGVSHEQVGDYPAALMWFGRAWSNAQTMESPALLLASMVGRMRTWRQWNRWDDAQEVASDILRLIDQYQQDEKRQFWALETLATIAYRQGNQELGDRYARQCKRLIDQQIEHIGDDEIPTSLSTRMHAIHLAREDWTRATADYKEKLRQSEPLPSPEVLTTLAELLVITGEPLEIQEQACERAIQAAEDSGAQKSLAIALRARGRMHMEHHHWKLADDDLRQSLRRCEVLDLPWERGQTLYQLAIFYRRRATTLNEHHPARRNADLGRSRYHFEQALGFFESLHATPSAERVRLALMQESKAPV